MLSWCKHPPPPTSLPQPLLVSVWWRLSVHQEERDGLRKTEGTVCWKERERIRKRCMDRQVWSGSSQPWWRLMGGWGDKSGEGGGEAAFVRRGARWKAGKMDGARGYRKVNQGSTEMMSTDHASATKWRRERGEERGGENVAKRDLWKEEIRER